MSDRDHDLFADCWMKCKEDALADGLSDEHAHRLADQGAEILYQAKLRDREDEIVRMGRRH